MTPAGRLQYAAETLTHMRAMLAAVDAGEVEATAVERAHIEGGVTALAVVLGEQEGGEDG